MEPKVHINILMVNGAAHEHDSIVGSFGAQDGLYYVSDTDGMKYAYPLHNIYVIAFYTVDNET